MSNFKGKVEEIVKTDKFSSGVVTALVIAIVMVVNALLYTVVSVFDLRFYYRAEYDYSLSGNTDELFADAIENERKVKISFCMGEEDTKLSQTVGEVYITAKNFADRYPTLVELDFINIITRRSEKTNELVNLSKYTTDQEGNQIKIQRTSVIFESGANHRVVQDYNFYTLDDANYITSYNGEEIVAAMMSWVLADEHKKAYFTERHGESADLAFTNLLACAGYYVETVDLRKEKVPDDADLLIISNPKSDFEASRDSNVFAEMDRLRAYVERGGNIYVALDPYSKTLPVLEGFLAEHGIEFSKTEVSDGKYVRNIVRDTQNAITLDSFTFVANYADGDVADRISDKVSSYGDGRVLVRDVAALTLSKEAKPILISSSVSSLKANEKTVSTSGSYPIAAYSEYTTGSNTKTNIFVVPSVFITGSDALIANGYSNKDFSYALLENLFMAEGMPYGCEPLLYSSDILENLTMGTAKIYTAVAMLIPATIAIVGAVVIIRRKNR